MKEEATDRRESVPIFPASCRRAHLAPDKLDAPGLDITSVLVAHLVKRAAERFGLFGEEVSRRLEQGDKATHTAEENSSFGSRVLLGDGGEDAIPVGTSVLLGAEVQVSFVFSPPSATHMSRCPEISHSIILRSYVLCKDVVHVVLLDATGEVGVNLDALRGVSGLFWNREDVQDPHCPYRELRQQREGSGTTRRSHLRRDHQLLS